jgi:hypothetical protein
LANWTWRSHINFALRNILLVTVITSIPSNMSILILFLGLLYNTRSY